MMQVAIIISGIQRSISHLPLRTLNHVPYSPINCLVRLIRFGSFDKPAPPPPLFFPPKLSYHPGKGSEILSLKNFASQVTNLNYSKSSFATTETR